MGRLLCLNWKTKIIKSSYQVAQCIINTFISEKDPRESSIKNVNPIWNKFLKDFENFSYYLFLFIKIVIMY